MCPPCHPLLSAECHQPDDEELRRRPEAEVGSRQLASDSAMGVMFRCNQDFSPRERATPRTSFFMWLSLSHSFSRSCEKESRQRAYAGYVGENSWSSNGSEKEPQVNASDDLLPACLNPRPNGAFVKAALADALTRDLRPALEDGSFRSPSVRSWQKRNGRRNRDHPR